MASWQGIALISTGWGPRCLSHAGAALLAEVYRVETFGLDGETRALVNQLHSLSHHAPDHVVWQNDELLAAAARALRLAQSDERAALVTPSGEIATVLWPIVQAAAQQLGLTVRFGHGLGLAESIASCLQLPLPPTVEFRAQLSDFVGKNQLPTLAIATEMGDLTDIASLYAGTARFFMVDLHAHQHKVVKVDITQPIPTSSNAFLVATQGEIALHHAHEEERELEAPIESAVLWVELLNGLTESVRG